jgi:hypothetical protein
MHTFKTVIIVACSIFWAATASAAGTIGYVGGSFGITTLNDDDRHKDYVTEMRIDDDSTGGQIFAGMTFNNWVGIEANISNLGEYRYVDSIGTIFNQFEVIAITAIFRTPQGRSPVSFYGKAGFGIISWEEDDVAFRTITDGTEGAMAFGVGLILSPSPDSHMSFRFAVDVYSFSYDDLNNGYEYTQSIGMSSFGVQANF